VFGSLDIGSAIGLVICGPLIAAAGWPSVFYLFAVLGLAWCLWWPLLRPESSDPAVTMDDQAAAQPAAQAQPAGGLLDAVRPSPTAALSQLAGIDSICKQATNGGSTGASAADPAAGLPWGKFMQSSAVWAVIVAHFCFKCVACTIYWRVASIAVRRPVSLVAPA
jgi:MFS transporter, ACS family, solute carrier family 17 (sodium-dependent inorganic phosphate cotransporter), other